MSSTQHETMAAPYAVYDPMEPPITALEWILLLRDSDPDARSGVLDDFSRWAQPIVKDTASSINATYRLDRNTWGDEIESLTYEAMLILVTQVVEGAVDPDELVSFGALLTFRARSRVRQFMDSSAGLNQASGQVGMKRRLKELKYTRSELLQSSPTGATPTPAEVVDATNRRMVEKRKDAARQGMICTLADYAMLDSGPLGSLDDMPEQAVPDPNDSPAAITAVEMERVIAETIARCRAESEVLGRVAAIWFDPATREGYDGHPSAADIAPLVALAPQTCRSKIAQVREMAQEVLRTSMGVSSVYATS